MSHKAICGMQEVFFKNSNLDRKWRESSFVFRHHRSGCAVCPSSQGKSLSRNRPSTGHPSVDVQLKDTAEKRT